MYPKQIHWLYDAWDSMCIHRLNVQRHVQETKHCPRTFAEQMCICYSASQDMCKPFMLYWGAVCYKDSLALCASRVSMSMFLFSEIMVMFWGLCITSHTCMTYIELSTLESIKENKCSPPWYLKHLISLLHNVKCCMQQQKLEGFNLLEWECRHQTVKGKTLILIQCR